MFKLKYKKQDGEYQIVNCNNLQEVSNEISRICSSSELEKCLKNQKEFNIRFYVTKKLEDNK